MPPHLVKTKNNPNSIVNQFCSALLHALIFDGIYSKILLMTQLTKSKFRLFKSKTNIFLLLLSEVTYKVAKILLPKQ